MSIATTLRLAPIRLLAYAITAAICAAIGFCLFTSSALAAIPTITDADAVDVNGNGTIDRVVITFSEAVAIDDTGAAADGFSSLAITNGCTIPSADYTSASTTTLTISNLTGCTTSDTDITPTITYTAVANCATNFSICDAAEANQMANAEAEIADDTAAPVVVSVSPTSAATGVNRNADVVITFSEPMDPTFAEATEFTVSPNPTGTQSGTFTVSNSVVTIALPTLNCGATYTVTTAEASIDAAAGTPTALITTGPEDGDWSFTTAGCGSSSGGSSSGTLVRAIDVNSPNGGQTYHAGDLVTVTWTGSNLENVALYYATATEGAYTLITSGLNNSGSYSWTVPDVSTPNAWIKAVGYSGIAVLASDTSDASFVIVGTPATPAPTPTPTPTPVLTPGIGLSPWSGLPEAVDSVAPGDVIRAVHYPTVYFIDQNLHRHPVPDIQTYFTYFDSWEGIRTVSDATLATLTIDLAVLPNPGVALVKILSDERVYAVEYDSTGGKGNLRLLPSEAVAVALYGASWSDYVIDVDSVYFTRYGHDADMSATDIVDRSIMRTRSFLNSR